MQHLRLLALLALSSALQLQPRRAAARRAPVAPLRAAAVAAPDGPRPGLFSASVGSKSLNPVGLLFGASMTIWVIALYPAVLSAALLSQLFDRKKRRPMDFMVKAWAKVSMLSLFYKPRVVGAEHLPPKSQPVLLVPNHCSYLDILTLSAYLPRPFKYISKVEILRIPFIGWAMGFAGHIALKRADRRSQLETFKDTVASLEAGNSVVAFAEGTRSPDGRLKKFKRGPFKMAESAKVDVVPVAICDLWRWHPPSALMPIAVPRGVELKVLPAIPHEGKTADELMALCQEAVDAALPAHQKAEAK